MFKTFNLYCDESCHLENDKMPYMLLGYTCVPFNQLKIHKENIDKIKKEHNYYGEVKWCKVSASQSKFYKALIDYFFASDMTFRAIVIDKSQINNSLFDQDFSTFYYKMYYQLIHHKLDMVNTYNVYLDIKDDLSALKVRKLKEILQSQYGVIRNLQNIRSHETPFLQLTDLLMGAISYHLRNNKRVKAKVDIINRIQRHSNCSLDRSTSRYEHKLNLFFIDLK